MKVKKSNQLIHEKIKIQEQSQFKQKLRDQSWKKAKKKTKLRKKKNYTH